MIAPTIARLIAASAVLAPTFAAPQQDASTKTEKQDFSPDLNKWVPVDSPTSAQGRWSVSLDGGKPVVARAVRQDPATTLPAVIRGPVQELIKSECTRGGRACFARLEDGWAVGLYGGEFGGGLWWISLDGKHRYRILNAQELILLPAKGGVLALGGLQNTGYVHRLVKGKDGHWEAKVLVEELGQVPGAAVVEAGGSVLIASFYQLLRVHPDGKVDELVAERWIGEDPNSIVVTAKGDIFIGGRHCVTRIVQDRAAWRVDYLLPSRTAVPIPPK